MYLRRSRACREPRNELLQLGDFFLALSIARFDPGPHLRFCEHHIVVAAGVGNHGLIVDVCNMSADLVQEMAVVRNDDKASVVTAKVILEPVHGIEVEVVRRFVQQQNIGIPEQRLRQKDPHFLPALKLAHRPIVKVFGNVQAIEQNCAIDFSRISALVADDPFKLTQAHAVLIRQRVRVLGVEEFALLQGFP